MKRIHSRAAAVLLATSLLAAACGDDDDSDDTSATTEAEETGSTETTAAPGAPIKLHQILTLTAATGVTNYVELEAAAKGMTEAFNERGGINGHPVELTVCDDASDPNKTTACARAAVDDGAAAVIAGSTRNEAQIVQVLSAAGIPLIGSQVNTSANFTDPISYPLNGSLLQLYGGAIVAMEEEGITSAGAWHTDVEQAKPVVDYIAATVQAAGMEWLGNVPQTPGAADFAPFAAAMAEKNPDAGIVVGSEATAVGLTLASAQTGAEYSIVGTDLTQESLDRLGDLADNYLAFGFFPPLDDDSPGMKRCMEDLDVGEEAGVDNLAREQRKISLTPVVCTTFYLIEEVTKDIDGDITSTNLRAALDAAEDIDTGGLIPPHTPSKVWSDKFPRVANPFVYLYAYEGGEIKALVDEPVNPLAAG